MEITFSGSITKKEYLTAAKLRANPILSKVPLFIEPWVLIVGFAEIIGIAGLSKLLADARFEYTSIILFILSVLLCVFGMRLRAVPYREWKRDKSLQKYREGSITDVGIEIRSPFKSNIEWGKFYGYGEYRDIVVLYRKVSKFTFVSDYPKRLFVSESAWEAFREMVISRIEKSNEVKPLKPSQILTWMLLAVVLFVVLYRVFL